LHKNGLNEFIYNSFVQGVVMVCERLHKVTKICPASQSRIIAWQKISTATGAATETSTLGPKTSLAPGHLS
jgi:hypothetical protein